MLDDDYIKAAIDQAKSATTELDDILRPVAFRTVLERLLAGTSGSSAISPAPIANQQSLGLPANLNEFLASVSPKSHVDRTTAMAFYSFRSGDDTGVTVEEVLDAYGRVRVAKPKNIHDVIAQCVKRGLLIESGSRKEGVKAWVVTPTGERYVQNDFQI